MSFKAISSYILVLPSLYKRSFSCLNTIHQLFYSLHNFSFFKIENLLKFIKNILNYFCMILKETVILYRNKYLKIDIKFAGQFKNIEPVAYSI